MSASISCVTLPVDDLQKSIAFYQGIGLALEDGGAEEDQASFDVDGVSLVLMERSEFSTFSERTGNRPAGRGTSSAIISYFAESKGDVDALIAKVKAAGGQTPGAKDEEWGYAAYFADPDGHVWEVVHHQD